MPIERIRLKFAATLAAGFSQRCGFICQSCMNHQTCWCPMNFQIQAWFSSMYIWPRAKTQFWSCCAQQWERVIIGSRSRAPSKSGTHFCNAVSKIVRLMIMMLLLWTDGEHASCFNQEDRTILYSLRIVQEHKRAWLMVFKLICSYWKLRPIIFILRMTKQPCFTKMTSGAVTIGRIAAWNLFWNDLFVSVLY